jgi:pimeloyl-ACP methyl ester carboxylesterase
MNRTELFLEHRGCQLAYTVCGDGTPVLFIQGTGLHGDGWLPQVNGLSDRYRCLTFDNRGMGRSQPVGAPITVEQMAEDALALMNAQGWKSAHLVGHSLGGAIALQLALLEPTRVRSLSLLCTFACGADATKLSWPMFCLGLRTYIGTRRMRRHAFLEMVMPRESLRQIDRDVLADQLATLFGHDLADHPPVVMKQLAALRKYDATSELTKLSAIPTLVISAEHDCISKPEIGKALAAGIPGARLVEIPEAAHGVPMQCAEKINSLLHEHFSGAEKASQPNPNDSST